MRAAILLSLLLALPAQADELRAPIAQPPKVEVEVKKPFRERHPKIHKFYSGTRWFCVKTKPFVDYAGSAANIARIFVR